MSFFSSTLRNKDWLKKSGFELRTLTLRIQEMLVEANGVIKKWIYDLRLVFYNPITRGRGCGGTKINLYFEQKFFEKIGKWGKKSCFIQFQANVWKIVFRLFPGVKLRSQTVQSTLPSSCLENIRFCDKNAQWPKEMIFWRNQSTLLIFRPFFRRRNFSGLFKFI